MSGELPLTNPETRVQWFAEDADLRWVADALVSCRDQILDRWLTAAAAQPFHLGRRERAVTDHIPSLFDALTRLLHRSGPRSIDPSAPLDDSAVLVAAQEHAKARVRQGLKPADVVIEFRLLRQEIWHALRLQLPDGVPTGDVIAAELMVNDALDGAIAVGLGALQDQIEEVQEDFLATTIHEVRQPLTGIKGQAQLAARALRAPNPNFERVLQALQGIETDANRMQQVLHMLLDSSRIVLGHLDLSPMDVDLAALINEAIDQAGPTVAERVSVARAEGLETTGRWDPLRLTQVFSNVLSNAGKYSPPGTPIRISVGGDQATVRIDVRDEGIGIAPEDLPRLFERYARGSHVIATAIEGVGLGLYLCRGIVQAHDGQIWAESDGPGTGTTIHVTLPRETSPRPSM